MQMITPYKIKKAFLYLKHFGPREFMNHLMDRLEPEEVPYDPWFHDHKATGEELARQRKQHLSYEPLISVIVPAYCTDETFLKEMIDSVRAQSYANWELCIADASDTAEGQERVQRVVRAAMEEDARVHLRLLPENRGISLNTNDAVEMARGDYLTFLDHDDRLAPDALFRIAKAVAETGADVIYTDEDKISSDGKKHLQPNFKPDFNLDLLRSNNYITHLFAVKKSLADQAGYFREEMNGAQDYDFIFRCTEMAEKIVHIPEILYHWRLSASSTADNPMSKEYAYEAGKRAIEEHLKRMGVKGEVERLPDFGLYRVHYAMEKKPLVSVIIPNKDAAGMLRECLDALFAASYDNIEVIIVENGSTERETFLYYKELSEDPRIHLVRWKKAFNYSAINNYGVRHAKGEYLLFLNNDVRGTISPDWLSEMVSMGQRSEVGVVGARLYYPNDKIQHAGVIIGIGGIAGAVFVDLPRGRSGYMHKAAMIQDLSAVTAACMLVRRSVFEEVGGFAEELAVAFNDVDLCLRIRAAGYLVVYDPFAELYHDESRTRGPEDSPEKVRRFQNEIEYMRTHHIGILRDGDPYYNKNLSLKKWNYSLRV